jgi:Iap family predicted aminopeptidase
VALFGPLPTELEHHKKLVAAQPAAVIHIDERLPFPWTKNDGVYPRWAQKHGMPPTITVPYTEAWRWRLAGLAHVRVAVDVQLEETVSQNVIGELPGSEPQLPAVVICAHHDTQCGNPGADDNGSGVMCVLELARILAPDVRRRTIRLISFGAEEQLSVGSAAYVRTHRRELKRTTGLVINFDSVSSPLGHFELSCIGSDSLATRAMRVLSQHDLDMVLRREVTPFVDNFPFNSAGLPSLYFGRANCPAGRWQHHSRHDTLENVSVGEVVRLLRGVTPLIVQLTREAGWTFPAGLPADQQVVARRLGRELFGF